jgi:uncharacterized damage-inducible protein DinB
VSLAETLTKSYALNRSRTLDLLDRVLKESDGEKILGWRPQPGRAHIGWQLMHIGVTEELFATERLSPGKTAEFQDLIPRFKGGSTPDDDIPTADQIRHVLETSRKHLLETLLNEYPDSRLGEIPPALAARGLTVQDWLHIIAWHEPHHHGQAHITLNQYKAAHAR